MVQRLLIDAAGILRLAVQVKSSTSVIVRQKFLDLPIVGFHADAEFEVFLCDGVPELLIVSAEAISR